MSLDTPTTKEIEEQIIAQLQASLNQTIPLLPKSFMRVLAKVLAGMLLLVYKYAGFIFLQMFVSQAANADTEVNGRTINPLVLWGRLIGVGDPIEATQAILDTEFRVSQDLTLPNNTQLISSVNGVTYITLGEVAATVAGPNSVEARAASDQQGGQGAGTIGNLTPAGPATLTIEFDTSGSSVSMPAGTPLVSNSTGATYLTVEDQFFSTPGTHQIGVISSTTANGGAGVGEQMNLPNGSVLTFTPVVPNTDSTADVTATVIEGVNGDTLNFANPIAGVINPVTITALDTPGAEAETTERYRERVIERFAARPQGGALVDYRVWGEEAGGDIAIYPYRSSCPGTVDVFVEDTDSATGTASAAQIQAVEDLINLDQEGLASRRPANAAVSVYSVSASLFDVQVYGLEEGIDSVAQMEIDITEAVTNYFLDREPFIPGLDVPPRRDRITRTELGGVISAVVAAGGGIFSSVFFSLNSSQLDTYSLGMGEVARMNSITFA